MTALIADGGETAHQLANAGAVNVTDGSEVQQNVFVTLARQIADYIAQNAGSFAQPKLADDVHDDDTIHQSRAGLEIHGPFFKLHKLEQRDKKKYGLGGG